MGPVYEAHKVEKFCRPKGCGIPGDFSRKRLKLGAG
jgi:hypothetical protein